MAQSPLVSGTKKGGFSKGVFANIYASLDCGALSVECTAKLANARSLYRAPKPQKCILKSEKCHSGSSRNMASKVNLNLQKGPFVDILISNKWTVLGTFKLTFGAIFLGGPKWHFSDFKMHLSGFRGSVGGSGVCNAKPNILDNYLISWR